MCSFDDNGVIDSPHISSYRWKAGGKATCILPHLAISRHEAKTLRRNTSILLVVAKRFPMWLEYSQLLWISPRKVIPGVQLRALKKKDENL